MFLIGSSLKEQCLTFPSPLLPQRWTATSKIFSFLCKNITFLLEIHEVIRRRTIALFGLISRYKTSDLLLVALLTVGHLEWHGKHHGYKLQHSKCLKAGYVVIENAAQLLLRTWAGMQDSPSTQAVQEPRSELYTHHSQSCAIFSKDEITQFFFL